MAKVFGRDRISEFKSGCAYKQVSDRNANAACLALAIDLTGSQSDGCGNWIDRNSRKQFLENSFAFLFPLRCVCAYRPMRQLKKRNHGNCDLLIACFTKNRVEGLFRIQPCAFSGDQHARIKDYSHVGGVSGSGWLFTAASTSLAKSASMVADEFSGSSAIHSAIVLRSGKGAWTTATGSLPFSITTSAPARTRANSPAKSLAASASEM